MRRPALLLPVVVVDLDGASIVETRVEPAQRRTRR
jgi:hypothetical protein